MLPDDPVRCGEPGDCYDDTPDDEITDDGFRRFGCDLDADCATQFERMIYQRCLFGCES